MACQVHASPQQVAGGAPLGRIDRGLGPPPAAQEPGNVLGVDRVVFGLAAMDGLHGEGMTEDNRATVCSTEVSTPVPGQHAFGSHDDLIAVGGDGLEKRLWGGLHVTVPQRFTGLVEDAHVHRAGVEIDATVIGVRCGVESHGGLLRVRDEGFWHSQQTTVVCWGGGLNKYQSSGANWKKAGAFSQQLTASVDMTSDVKSWPQLFYVIMMVFDLCASAAPEPVRHDG